MYFTLSESPGEAGFERSKVRLVGDDLKHNEHFQDVLYLIITPSSMELPGGQIWEATRCDQDAGESFEDVLITQALEDRVLQNTTRGRLACPSAQREGQYLCKEDAHATVHILEKRGSASPSRQPRCTEQC